jgi:UDP-N-acetylmuramoylalanine--D-glutamate ligase
MDATRFTGKRITIMGLGFFGGSIGLARYLVSQGAQVTITDVKPAAELQDSITALHGLPVRFVLGGHERRDFTDADMVFASPAVRQDSAYLMAARTHGVPLDTEMNLFMRLCRGSIIGVTGSNGKTTTTSLIGAILRAQNPRTQVGGNIGHSLLPEVENIEPGDPVVLELSSFQLADLAAVGRSPHIGLFLNLSPNHLDRHGTMEAYLAAKMQIFAHQGPDDVAILNADDPPLLPIVGRLRSRVRQFSAVHAVEAGAYVDGDYLVVSHSGRASGVCRLGDIPLLGRHNVANVLAAVAAADACGVSAVAMRAAIRAFPGVEHRLEHVRTLQGVSFYNDSIATTPTGTLAALAAIQQPIWLIAGGYDKGLPFATLGEAIGQRVKGVFLIGTTAPKIAQAIAQARPPGNDLPAVRLCADLHEAVLAAFGAARPGEVVLLSPACASYDQFRNFVERGRLFKQLVCTLES